MSSRTNRDEVAKVVHCVQRAIRKCGRTTKEFFEHALRSVWASSDIEDAADEFDDLDPNDLPRKYSVPGEVAALARHVERHANPQELFPQKCAA